MLTQHARVYEGVEPLLPRNPPSAVPTDKVSDSRKRKDMVPPPRKRRSPAVSAALWDP